MCKSNLMSLKSWNLVETNSLMPLQLKSLRSSTLSSWLNSSSLLLLLNFVLVALSMAWTPALKAFQHGPQLLLTLCTASTTVSLCVRCSFTCWFTVRHVEASPLSPPHDLWAVCNGRVTCEDLGMCSMWEVVGADRTSFLQGSLLEFHVLFCCEMTVTLDHSCWACASTRLVRLGTSIVLIRCRMTITSLSNRSVGSRSGTTDGQTNVCQLCRVGIFRFNCLSSSACALTFRMDRWADSAKHWCMLPPPWQRACCSDCSLSPSGLLRIKPMTSQKLSTCTASTVVWIHDVPCHF